MDDDPVKEPNPAIMPSPLKTPLPKLLPLPLLLCWWRDLCLIGMLAVLDFPKSEPDRVPLGDGGGGGVLVLPVLVLLIVLDRPYLTVPMEMGEGTRLTWECRGEPSDFAYPIGGDEEDGRLGRDMYKIASSLCATWCDSLAPKSSQIIHNTSVRIKPNQPLHG